MLDDAKGVISVFCVFFFKGGVGECEWVEVVVGQWAMPVLNMVWSSTNTVVMLNNDSYVYSALKLHKENNQHPVNLRRQIWGGRLILISGFMYVYIHTYI